MKALLAPLEAKGRVDLRDVILAAGTGVNYLTRWGKVDKENVDRNKLY